MKAALHWIHANTRQLNIGTAKITALGFSAGGELVALIGTTRQNRDFKVASYNIKTLSNVNAIADLYRTLSFVHPELGEGNDTKSI